MAVMARKSTLAIVEDLSQVVNMEETVLLRDTYSEVHVSNEVAGFIMDIVEATRDAKELVNGVSTRGAIALYKAAQVTAAIEGRDYVIPEDVVREAVPVLAHRVSANSGSREDTENYLRRKLKEAVVPLEDLNAL